MGEISICVDRNRWKEITRLDSADQADTQLREAAKLARGGNWGVDPLPRLLGKACEIIQARSLDMRMMANQSLESFPFKLGGRSLRL